MGIPKGRQEAGEVVYRISGYKSNIKDLLKETPPDAKVEIYAIFLL